MTAERFEAFTAQHYLLLGIFLAGAAGLVAWGRSGRTGRRFDRAFAVVIAAVTVPSQLYQLAPWDFSLDTSLPLALCDFAWVAAVWALWTRHPVPTALIYYWGLTLTIQAIITPSLGQAFPDPRFFMFWSMHFLIVWSAIYLAFGLRLGPRWGEYRIAVGVTLGWAALAYAFDVAADVNYGYLVRKPRSASLLDLLGPWPVYVLASLGLLIAGWALLTWPWVGPRKSPAPGRDQSPW